MITKTAGSPRRVLFSTGWLIATFLVLAATAGSARAQVIRDFTSRYSRTDRGNFVAIGNTLVTCPDAASACAAARAGTGSTNNNQDFTMVAVDVDTVEPGATSSSATLTLPSGAAVQFAGLYWGASSSSAARNQARLRTPASSSYTTLTAAQLDASGSAYHAYANVTTLVAAAGSGVYTVADVKATTGTNAYAGWSLVVVYSDSTDTPRNVTVFDGYAIVTSGQGAVSVPVSGFVTPPSGTVSTRLGVVAYEGDLGSPGNSLRLNSVALTNAVNAANNFFNSTISVAGAHVAAKTPNYVNQLGYDIDAVDASGILTNASTSAVAQFSPGSDNFFPGALVFATDIFQPLIAPNFTKTVTDVNGGYVAPDDILLYTINVANTGNDAADSLVLTDAIPSSTTYVPGSLTVVSGANAGTKTDGSGDDQAEYDSANNRVVFRLGTGATSAAGGSLVAAASTSISFRVRIGAATANGTSISNSARLGYVERQLGGAMTVDSTTATATLNLPDLTVTKSHSATFVRGSTASYAVAVRNSGVGPTSGTVTMADSLPAGLVPTIASGSGWSCSILSQTVTCTRTDALVAGSSYPTVTIDCAIAQSAAASLTNTATASGGGQLNTANDSASDPTTIVSSADLSVAKSGPASVFAGGTVAYTVAVTNNGPSDAASVVVADPTPSGLTFVSNTGACTTAYPCSLGTVAAGTTRTITTTYSLPIAYSGPSTIVNTATVSSSTADPVSGNDSASASTSVPPSTDLSISKSGPATVVAGNQVVYTVTVSNLGGLSAAAVTVADPTPSGLTFVSNTGACTTAYPCSLGAVAASGTRTITSTYLVSSGYAAPGPISNTATVSTTTTDSVSGNNTASSSTTVTTSADLSIAKTGPASIVPGTNAVFTVVVSNLGTSDAAAVSVTDPTPSGLTFVSNTGACTTAYPCSLGTVAAGATRTITTTYSVPASYTAPDPVVNTATVASTTSDPAAGNGSSTSSTPVIPSADLAITKTGPASTFAGSTVTYTVAVTNNGTSDAASVVVSDPTPSGLTFVSNTGACTTAYPCSLGTVAAGATRTITTTYLLPITYSSPSTIVNTATVSSATADPVSANDSASASTSVTSSTDLAISKSGPASVVAGTELVYTVTVSNLGGENAAAVTVADTTPTGLTFVSNSGDCTTAYPCALGSVEAGGIRTITSRYAVPPSYAGADPILNSASVSSSTADFFPGNNTATSSTPVERRADLAVVKTGPVAVVAGETAVYTVVVSNLGASDAAAVSVADPVPSGLTFVSNAGDCTSAYPCALGVVEAGGIRTITSTYSVPASYTAPDPVVNIATVSSATTDPVAGNDSSTSSIALTTSADVGIVKSAPGSVVAGENLEFTLVVTNHGSSDAASVSVDDPTPAGLVFQGNSGDCTGAFPCALGTLAPGATRTITSTYRVPASYAGPEPIVNTADVSSSTGDPSVGNNSSTTSTSVTRSADLRIAKTGPASVLAGEDVVYTVTVTNDGSSDAAAVEVADPTPTGLVFQSNGGDCTGAYPCALGTLAAGASRTITTTYRVPASWSLPGPIVNTAAVSSTTADPDSADNTASASTSVSTSADLTILKDGPATVVAGTNAVYTVTVTNNGISDAAAVTVVDPTPGGLSFLSNTGDCTTTYPCELGTLVPGESRSITSTFRVAPSYAPPGPLLNTASVSSTTTDPSPGDNSATASAAVTASADVEIVNVAQPAVIAGNELVYTVVVRNNGVSDATGVAVAFPTPAGLTFVSNEEGCTSAYPCALGTLEPGDSITITSTYSVPLSYTTPDPILGTATVSSTSSDPNAANDSSTGSTDLTIVDADLEVVKTGPASVVPGNEVVYTVVVTNHGPDPATDTVVIDVTPDHLVFAANTGDCASTYPCSLGSLGVGETRTITSRYTVPSSYTAPDPILNTARVFSAAGDSDPLNNRSTASTDVNPSADLVVGKTGPASAIAGTQVVYTVTVHNAGPSDAYAVAVSDPIPAGLTFVSNAGDCRTAYPCSIDQLAAGATATIASTYAIPASYAVPGLIENLVTATAVTDDPAPGDNSALASTSVTASADLAVSLTAPAAAVPGQDLVYTITVTNHGSSDASSVTVTDASPPGMGSPANAGDCTTAYPCALGTLAPGETRTFTSTYSVPASYTAPDPVENAAFVSSSTTDPVPGNDSSSASTPVVGSADLSVSATGPAAVIPGEDLVYTVTITNHGSSDAAAVVVANPTPAGVSFVSNTGACLTAYPCSLGVVPAGATRTMTATYAVPPSYLSPDPVVSTATVSSSTADPVPGNDSFLLSIPVSPSADLSVANSGPASVVAGTSISYTLVVTNSGSSDAAAVTVSDPLPPGLVWTGNAGDCTTTFPCALGTLAPGSTRTITSTYSVSPSYAVPGPIVNTATVSSSTADPDASDDTASATTTVTSVSDLAITKTDATDPIETGRTQVYTLTVRNFGPSDATSVVVTDTPDAATSYSSSSGSCSLSSGVLTCAVGTLASGASTSFTVSAVVHDDAPFASTLATGPCDGSEDICNSATVSGAGSDPDLSNNSASQPTDVEPLRIEGLALAIADAPDAVLPGGALQYTVTYSNAGTETISGVVLDLAYDPRTTFVSADPVPSVGDNQWSIGRLSPGEVGRIVVNVQVDGGAVDGDSLLVEAELGGSHALVAEADEATFVREDGPGRASMTVVKTVTPESGPSGGLFTFTITVSNTGTATAYATTLTDELPDGLAYLNAAPSPDVVSGQSLEWQAGDFAPGTTQTLVVYAQADADLPAGTLLENTALASGTVGPGTLPGAGLEAEGSVVAWATGPVSDCGLVLRMRSVGIALPGGEFVYRLLWSDPCEDAPAVTLVQDLPPELTFLTISGADHQSYQVLQAGDHQQLVIDVGTVGLGRTGVAFVRGRIADDALPGTRLSSQVQFTDAAGRTLHASDDSTVRDAEVLAVTRSYLRVTGPLRVLPDATRIYVVRYRDVVAGSAVRVSIGGRFVLRSLQPPPTRTLASTGDSFAWIWEDLGPRGIVKIRGSAPFDGPPEAGGVFTVDAELQDEDGTDVVKSGRDVGVLRRAVGGESRSLQKTPTVLKTQHFARGNANATTRVRYRKLGSAPWVTLNLPTFLAVRSMLPDPPAASLDNALLWDDLPQGTGLTVVKARVPDDLVPQASLAVGATVTDEYGTISMERAKGAP